MTLIVNQSDISFAEVKVQLSVDVKIPVVRVVCAALHFPNIQVQCMYIIYHMAQKFDRVKFLQIGVHMKFYGQNFDEEKYVLQKKVRRK